jgi:uncharacterized protein (DUF2225 family)
MINIKSIDGSSLKVFEANTVISRTGEPGGGRMYIIAEGKAGVYKNYGESNQTMLTEMKSGVFFGEREFFLNESQTDTIVALSELKVFEITKDNVMDFFSNNPDAACALIEALCGRVEKVNGEYEKLRALIYEAKEEGPVSSLFPAGHKHYVLRDPDVKKGLLRDDIITCPMCNNKFNFPHVRTVVLRTLSMDSDLRRHYDGINMTHYLVATCPKCLFSTITEEFGKAAKKNQAQILKATIRYKSELNVQFDKMNADAIFARLYLALICAPLCYDNPEMLVARLWINVSWLYRDCGDKEMEKYAMEKALKAYLKVYATVRIEKKTEQSVCLIIGELSYKLGDIANAKKFLFAVKTSKEGNAAIEAFADDRLIEIKKSRL